MILTPKRSTDTTLFNFDWRKELDGDAIASFVLTRTAGTVVLSNQGNTASAVTALIAGGVNGETATLTLRVTTAAGQVLNRDYSLLIADTAAGALPSTSTKRQIAEMAVEEVGLAGYEFDTTPEEWASLLRRLDALMAEWAGIGLNLGYLFPATFGGSDLDDASGIPDSAINTVSLFLAQRYMPAIGKGMSAETRVAMSQGITALRAQQARIPNRPLPAGTVRGAGMKPAGQLSPFTQTDINA